MCLAIPGEIVSIEWEEGFFRKGRVSFGGIVKEINLAYVPEGKIGDYVIVHAGFAIQKINPTEARKVFDYLSELESLEELRSS